MFVMIKFKFLQLNMPIKLLPPLKKSNESFNFNLYEVP